MRITKRSLWLLGAWVAATIATAGVTLAVVGLAGEQVADAGIQPLSAREVAALGVAAPLVASTTSSTGAATSTTLAVAATVADSTTTTTIPAATTSTTLPTTTTAAPEAARIDSRQITGGTVVVRWTSSSVELVSASPTDGFHVDVENRGPDQVTVEFEGNGVKSKYSAEISDGRLVVDTGVEAEGD